MSATVALPREKEAHTLEDLLMKVAWLEYRRFCRELNNHQLTPPQFYTLVAIKENGLSCTMSQLADETNQVSATMTGIIDRLVERGWVERWRDPHDRRAVLVCLTEVGRSKLENVYQASQSVLANSLENMDETSRHNLFFSLKQYLQVVGTS
jgi:DNA-binding MarR family transcriptional regulator